MSDVADEPAADPIRSLECFDCKVPLPRPLQVGASTVSHRSYVIVRVTAASGAQGTGFSFGRGLPVAAIIQQAFASIVVGADSVAHQLVAARLRSAYWPYAEGSLFATAAATPVARRDPRARGRARPSRSS